MKKPHILKRNGYWNCEGSFGLTPKLAYEMHLAFEKMNKNYWDEFNRKFENEHGTFFSRSIDGQILY